MERADTITLDELRRRTNPEARLGDIDVVDGILRGSWERLSRNQIDALRLRVDIATKLLGKSLPDVKAVEHSLSAGDDRIKYVFARFGDPVVNESAPSQAATSEAISVEELAETVEFFEETP